MSHPGGSVSVEQVPASALKRGDRAMDAHNEPFTVGRVRVRDFCVEIYDKDVPDGIALEVDEPDDLVLRVR